jgi:hypothetical protein
VRGLRWFSSAVSNAWFALRVWVRYDMLWTGLGRTLLVVASVFPLVGAVLVKGSSPPSPAPTRSVVTVVTSSLPRVPPPELDLPVPVLVIGDSLVAGEEAVYGEALVSSGFAPSFDAVVSRGLRFGMVCPSSPVPVVEEQWSGAVDTPSEGTAFDDLADVPGGAVDDTGLAADASSTGSASPRPGFRATEAPSRTGCRGHGLEELARYAREGALPGIVVVALGTNDALLPAGDVLHGFRQLRGLLPGRLLVLVEVAVEASRGSFAAWNAAAREWCLADDACRFVEWSSGGSGLFVDDGLHLSSVGAQRRAAAIASALTGVLPYATGLRGASRR